MRVVAFIVGLIIAALGGVLAYRALFLHTGTDFVVTNTGDVHEVRNWLKAGGSILMMLIGAGIAFMAARRRR